MAANESVRRVSPDERVVGDLTAGMVREEAIAVDGLWVGLARTEPGMVSGWHHHGEHESVIYVLSGALRMEFGPNGEHVLDTRPGDFISVPKGVVHRESNPSDEPADIIVVRAGRGESTYNVTGPA